MKAQKEEVVETIQKADEPSRRGLIVRPNGATKIISMASVEFTRKVRGQDYYGDDQPAAEMIAFEVTNH